MSLSLFLFPLGMMLVGSLKNIPEFFEPPNFLLCSRSFCLCNAFIALCAAASAFCSSLSSLAWKDACTSLSNNPTLLRNCSGKLFTSSFCGCVALYRLKFISHNFPRMCRSHWPFNTANYWVGPLTVPKLRNSTPPYWVGPHEKIPAACRFKPVRAFVLWLTRDLCYHHQSGSTNYRHDSSWCYDSG